MRTLAILLSVVAVFVGLVGWASKGGSLFCMGAVVLMIVGALLFTVGGRQAKAAEDERKHEEMLAAIREAKK